MAQTAGKLIGKFGSSYPFIKINGYGPFSQDEILYFNIDTSGFLPTCSLRLELTYGIFLSTAFPKDGDILNLYIRSLSNSHKPIRNDYIITSVSTTRSEDNEGEKMIYYISGELYVPNLYKMISKSWKDKNSYEVLLDIATELKLGFVSNENQSDLIDKQNWISPNFSYEKMIEHVTQHSYSNDESFYISYIDYYYNLNFINLNPLFSVKDNKKADDGILRGSFNIDDSITDDIYTEKQPFILTNADEMKTSNYYFNSFRLINNSGIINKEYGYFPNITFFDKKQKKFWNWDISPIITDGAEKEKIVMLGRANDNSYKDFKIPFYKSIQYTIPDDNCHPYWNHAEIQNKFNLEFSSKLQIELFLPLFNFNLYKCQVVPVNFMVTKNDDRGKIAGKADDDQSMKIGWTVDRFLTGLYVVFELNIKYEKDILEKTKRPAASTDGIWTVSLNLRRREWPVPDKKIENNV